jgi:hypothetical protein
MDVLECNASQIDLLFFLEIASDAIELRQKGVAK